VYDEAILSVVKAPADRDFRFRFEFPNVCDAELGGMMVKCIFALIVLVAMMATDPAAVRSAGPLRIGVPSPSVSYFPLIVAWKKGFFAQQGIQAEFIVMRPSIIPAAMTNGEIHFSTATGTIVGAALRGFPFKIVTYYSVRLMDSMVAKSQISSVTDLRGKIVGVDGPGASTYVMTVLILRKYNLDPEREVKVLAIGDENIRLEQLKLGQIDAGMLGPQGVVLARRAGLKTLLDVADEIDLPFAGLGTTIQMIDGHQDELRNFLRASVRGNRYSTDPANRNEMISLIGSWLHLDHETAEHTYNVFLKATSKDGMLGRTGMEALINERKRQAKITADVPVERVFDFSFLQEINQQTGK
jgi:ABC-type nitrate/sulfonate/bicarbonate transport system substrate-binding protein